LPPLSRRLPPSLGLHTAHAAETISHLPRSRLLGGGASRGVGGWRGGSPLGDFARLRAGEAAKSRPTERGTLLAMGSHETNHTEPGSSPRRIAMKFTSLIALLGSVALVTTAGCSSETNPGPDGTGGQPPVANQGGGGSGGGPEALPPTCADEELQIDEALSAYETHAFKYDLEYRYLHELVGEPVDVSTDLADGFKSDAIRFYVSPELPEGLDFDASTGAISGAAEAADEGGVYTITARSCDGEVYHTGIWLQFSDVPAGPTHIILDQDSGDDANSGEVGHPIKTVARAKEILKPGDTLFIREGIYLGHTSFSQLQGTAGAPITIRAYPGEKVMFSHSLPDFMVADNDAWEKPTDPNAHPEEWVSKKSYPAPGGSADSWSRGAFIDGDRYNRLATYSALEDLRAENEKHDRIFEGLHDDDTRPGPWVMDAKTKQKKIWQGQTNPPSADPLHGKTYRMPWLYAGPGIYYDQTTQKIHIRLSYTHNDVQGLADYTGETDPRKLRLAINRAKGETSATAVISAAKHLRFEDLTFAHGGSYTIRMTHFSEGIALHHVRILASTGSSLIQETKKLSIQNSVFDGGIPSWHFRSDYKDGYDYEKQIDGQPVIVTNGFVRKTQRALGLSLVGSTDTTIAHTEFRNGHDVYVGGCNTQFRHNFTTNIQDETFYFSHAPKTGGNGKCALDNLFIHHNVIEQATTGMTFNHNPGGDRFVYRNIFDFRKPVPKNRPRLLQPDARIWAEGHLFKHNGPVGPPYFYQNTVMLRNAASVAYYHWRPIDTTFQPTHTRHFLNNSLLLFGEPENKTKMAWVPVPEYLAATDGQGRPVYGSDGNLWHRYGDDGGTFFQRWTAESTCTSAICLTYDSLAEFQQDPAYQPYSFEQHSIEANPQLRLKKEDGIVRAGDSYRPAATSPAVDAGVELPDWLVDEDAPGAGEKPTIGALEADGEAMRVGPYGARAY